MANQVITNQLTSIVQPLSTSLQAIQPISTGDNQTTQIITYALIATAVVGIFVYRYIKQQEINQELEDRIKEVDKEISWKKKQLAELNN